jgi:putative transposase
MSAAVTELPKNVCVAPLCAALNLPRSSVRARRHSCRPPAPLSKRALPAEVRARVLTELHSTRFIDCSPAEVFYTLLSEDRYLCSERSMYRILHSRGEVKERRAQRRHPNYQRPELMATAPNQVWSWDITRLRTYDKWKYLYLYVVIDIFSRAVVGWLVANVETAALGIRLIDEAVEREGVRPATLVLHADRGTQMTSKTMAQLLADLDVGRSFSRPQVSNDNPFSESAFKTMKYHAMFPSKFRNLTDAKDFCRGYFTWYNEQHRHSGIAYLTPAMMHAGNGEHELQRRHEVMLRAYATHPERFSALHCPPPSTSILQRQPCAAKLRSIPGCLSHRHRRRRPCNLSAAKEGR